MDAAPAYLLVVARTHDRARFASVVAMLQPLMAAYGGRPVAVASSASVESFGPSQSSPHVLVWRWPTMEQLLRVWHSPECRRLAALRAGGGEVMAAAIRGEAGWELQARQDPLVLVMGNGPTPALFEAQGATLLAQARGSQVEVLQERWLDGDIALYRFADLDLARQLLSRFSSGQRARCLLVPGTGHAEARESSESDTHDRVISRMAMQMQQAANAA